MAPQFTATQIVEARRKLGLTQIQLADMLGIGLRQVKRLEGDAPANSGLIQPYAARLLQAYLDGYRPADWPDA